MEIGLDGLKKEIDWALLGDRFPEISFLLTMDSRPSLALTKDVKGYFHAEGVKGALYSEDIEEEMLSWKGSLALDRIDILYVYGIGLGYYYLAIKEWLLEKKERVLVFLEDDLSVLNAFFCLPIGLEVLQNPQVHIRYLPDSSSASWDLALDESVREWISDKVDFSALLSYSTGSTKKINALRLLLLRKASLVHVGISELLHYHILMKNIASNVLEIPHSFHVNEMQGKYKNIPAIICGAGVSLSLAIPFLKTLEHKALIFAGGSAITALGHHGIKPHISMALDPNDEEYTRLKGSSCFEEPFIYSSRLHKDALLSSNVKAGYLRSDTGGSLENWVHKELDLESDSIGSELGMEALSVTTLAAPLARHFGCNPILFCGVDLSYQNKERYAPGVLPSSTVFLEELQQEERSMEKLVRRKNGEGKFVHSLVKWVMESSCLGSYAKNVTDTQFFSASPKGLPIANVPLLSIEEFVTRYCDREYDLRGLLHVEAEMAGFAISKEKISSIFQDLTQSLEKCLQIEEDMIKELEERLALISDLSVSLESGKMSLFEMDLQEQPAYTACLQYAFAVYPRMLERCYPCLAPLTTFEGRNAFLQKKKRLWEECYFITKECKDILGKYIF